MNWLHTEADLVIKGIYMNIEEQRKAFEVVAEKLGYQLDKWSDGEYVNDSTKTALKLWQASATREGYKLVLVEPTQSMVDKAVCDTPETPSQDYWHDSQPISDDQAIACYKSMIGEETK